MAAPPLLAGRYAFTRRVRGTQRTIIWVARDLETGAPVVASVLTPNRVAGLAPAIGVAHPHAAAVLAVIDGFEPEQVPSDEPPTPDAKIVIAEYVEGRSLQQRLDAGPVTLENAVDWTTSVADALATLHARGAVHGALSPRSVLVIRPEPAVVPKLTHLLVPPSGAYCSPERVTGEGPSKADDIWALAATLYTALARRPPFQGASRTELARAIVAAAPRSLDDVDPDLWLVVSRALSREAGGRFETAAAFRDALREWTEMTGRRSIGDFAPVEAMIGVSEEPPNVGDLSLVAALARPDSAEALAPLDVPLPSLRPSLDPYAHEDPSEPPRAEPPTAAPGSAPAQSPVSTTVVVATPLAPKPARRSAPLVAGIAAGAATAAAIFVYATKEPAGGTRGGAATTSAPPGSATANATPPGSATATATARGVLETPSASSVASTPGATSATAVGESAALAASSATAAGESAALAASSATAPNPGTSAATPVAAGDASACAVAILPEGTLGESPDVGFLCTNTDLWGMTRRVNQQVLRHGTGAGLVSWAHLGRFDLAAVALVRRRCCAGAPAFTAATPKGLCESLTSSIDAVAGETSAPNIDHYAADVDCLVSHAVRYPAEWWDRLSAKQARGYFEQFIGELRAPSR
ncbi:MAG TPA: hypothetical protein VHC69_18290 [Polyangiaceae bacterium]|nr:hypothetical protein [Polyangiaceae bacterium]